MKTFGGRTGEAMTELGSLLAALSPNPKQAQTLMENLAHMEDRGERLLKWQRNLGYSLPCLPTQLRLCGGWWTTPLSVGGLFQAKLWLLHVSCPHGNPSEGQHGLST